MTSVIPQEIDLVYLFFFERFCVNLAIMQKEMIFFVCMAVLFVLAILTIGGIMLYDEIKTYFNKRKKDIISEEINLF